MGSETTSANVWRCVRVATLMVTETPLSWMPENRTLNYNKLLRNLRPLFRQEGVLFLRADQGIESAIFSIQEISIVGDYHLPLCNAKILLNTPLEIDDIS